MPKDSHELASICLSPALLPHRRVASFTYGGPSGWRGRSAVGAAAAILGIAPDNCSRSSRSPNCGKKILITLIFLVVYRIGYYIPLPMVDQAKLAEKMASRPAGRSARCSGSCRMFSGGNLSSACIFALGIMPYISASIIIQLLAQRRAAVAGAAAQGRRERAEEDQRDTPAT